MPPFDPSTPSHLQALLDNARGDIASGDPRRLRLAGFQMVDYYTATLVSVASQLKLQLRGGMGLEAMNGVFAVVRGLDPKDVRFLEGLRPFRNQLAHKVDFVPASRVLNRFVAEAPAIHARLAAAVAAQQKAWEGLEAFPGAAARVLAEVKSSLEEWATSYEAARAAEWHARLEHVVNENRSLPTMEEIAAYAELISLRDRMWERENDYLEGRAEDAAADEMREAQNDWDDEQWEPHPDA